MAETGRALRDRFLAGSTFSELLARPKDNGALWDAIYKRQHPPGFRWLHESFGTNWRMMEMQAASAASLVMLRIGFSPSDAVPG